VKRFRTAKPAGLTIRISCVSASACGLRLADARENRHSGATLVITTTTAEKLLARVANGDRDAFSELYDRYASAVYGACLRVLREQYAAEDAAQEAFAALWRHAGAFDAARGAAGAWIGRVARNAALDASRRRALRVTAPEVEAADDSENPEDLAVAADEAFQLRVALDALPERERDVLALAYGEGLTQSEIAERLRLPLGTVKTRTRSGLARLAEHVELTR
jgi:RNA polymerase sigma-70 factor (ECF subfamily)